LDRISGDGRCPIIGAIGDHQTTSSPVAILKVEDKNRKQREETRPGQIDSLKSGLAIPKQLVAAECLGDLRQNALGGVQV
jgi:hypothetical protein